MPFKILKEEEFYQNFNKISGTSRPIEKLFLRLIDWCPNGNEKFTTTYELALRYEVHLAFSEEDNDPYIVKMSNDIEETEQIYEDALAHLRRGNYELHSKSEAKSWLELIINNELPRPKGRGIG